MKKFIVVMIVAAMISGAVAQEVKVHIPDPLALTATQSKIDTVSVFIRDTVIVREVIRYETLDRDITKRNEETVRSTKSLMFLLLGVITVASFVFYAYTESSKQQTINNY